LETSGTTVGFELGIIVFFVILLALGLHSATAMAAESADRPIAVYLAGDSTMASYPANRAPLTGWGQVFQRFFTDAVMVKNHAVSGRSSKSFIDEGRLDAILRQIQPGDYLLIQFAHNDEKATDPKRYTEPQTTFKAYLIQYVEGARAKGAHPVLITPMHRRGFSSDGSIRFSHGDYPQAILELAAEMQVPVIDLHQKSQVLFERLGPVGTKQVFLWLEKGEHPNYPDGKEDNTHFSEYGAVEIAKLVAEGLKEANLPLADHLKD
jgi:lysophospholipase L1-like esterase